MQQKVRQLFTLATLSVLFAQIVLQSPARADETRDRQWHLGFLDVAAAHRISQGEGVTVGVVDSGVDIKHPDLASAVLPGTNFVGGDGSVDGDGHGTKMAGLIAARGRPGDKGALGIAPRAKILPVDSGIDNWQSADGVDWAVEHGARVLCLAFGSESVGTDLPPAIERALAADVVIVAAAGNRPENGNIVHPARHPGVVAAAGIDKDGNHASVSATGPEVVLAAPAVDIVSTSLNNGYSSGTGTSDATAIIAGAAALVRSKFPDLKASEVVRRLTATAVDKGAPGRDDEYGYGVVNLVGALTADVPASAVPTPDAAQPPAGNSDGSGPDPVAVVLLGLFVVGAVGIVGITALSVRRSRRAGRGPPGG
ncbi:hypothetical protein Val02_87110 [Virgisporangium aliadipatigenens]|uniref:Peptidase S8/S53 domain-containing protein n=1 Tax=Virgisporangium aliadipatigenens TaxID=741659 RepID=A0A8J3YXX9_9ACTN|nr:S8 family serine peptidase [Virgisporangium aliadipatigenens]GIJ51825.1 hypothetical protein Val02_87110 [Virgisporangium aliadipatigenens]